MRKWKPVAAELPKRLQQQKEEDTNHFAENLLSILTSNYSLQITEFNLIGQFIVSYFSDHRTGSDNSKLFEKFLYTKHQLYFDKNKVNTSNTFCKKTKPLSSSTTKRKQS